MKTKNTFFNALKKRLLPLRPKAALAAIGLLPISAFASDDDVLTQDLDAITGWISSGPATAVILLAIVGAGYLWLFKGVLPKAYAIGVIGGAGLIYSAGFIGNLLVV